MSIVEVCEHVPGADRATVAIVLHELEAWVWLDDGDRANLVATVSGDGFQTGGPEAVSRVLDLCEADARLPAAPECLCAFVMRDLPVVRSCLPYWSAS